MNKEIEELLKSLKKYEKEKARRKLNETHENYIRRIWSEELKAYNRENKTDVINVYETSENKRYAVNRGIHTMKFQREFWKEKELEPEKEILENKIVLIYGGKKGILKPARKIKQIGGKIFSVKIKNFP